MGTCKGVYSVGGAGGSAGAALAFFFLFFTGWPSSPTTRTRGWLRKGCWSNSTSFSDRLP